MPSASSRARTAARRVDSHRPPIRHRGPHARGQRDADAIDGGAHPADVSCGLRNASSPYHGGHPTLASLPKTASLAGPACITTRRRARARLGTSQRDQRVVVVGRRREGAARLGATAASSDLEADGRRRLAGGTSRCAPCTSPGASLGRRGSANERRGTPVISIAGSGRGAAPIVNVMASRRESRQITKAVTRSPIADGDGDVAQPTACLRGAAAQPKNTSTCSSPRREHGGDDRRAPPLRPRRGRCARTAGRARRRRAGHAIR